MASTIFNDSVTHVPADWANDVNNLVYNVFQNSATLEDIHELLGTDILTKGGIFTILGGSINNAPIGATTPSTGKFTRLQVTGSNTSATDVVTFSKLTDAINGATVALKSMAFQENTNVDIVGGTIDGVSIGKTLAGEGHFTKLTVVNTPTDINDVVPKGWFDTHWATLPTFGDIVVQNKNAIDITNGKVDAIIGSRTPTLASFTDVTLDSITNAGTVITLDGSVAGYSTSGLVIKTSNNLPDINYNIIGSYSIKNGSNLLDYKNGCLTLDGAFTPTSVAIDTTATIKGGRFLIGNTTPQSGNEAISRQWMQNYVANQISTVNSEIRNVYTAIATAKSEAQGTIEATSGSIDGVIIGGTTPDKGYFTSVTTPIMSGNYGYMRFDNVGGYAGSGAFIAATDLLRPNISVAPNADGLFAVLSGGVSIFKTSTETNNTVVGLGSDNGFDALQVYGSAVIHGRLTLDGDVIEGSTTPTLGSNAPALVRKTPTWMRVRFIDNLQNVREGVVPIFEVQ